jgi:hypothetical protein
MDSCIQCVDSPEHTVLLNRLQIVKKEKKNVLYLRKLLITYYLAVTCLSTGDMG